MIHGKSFIVPKQRVIACSAEFGHYAWSFPNLTIVYGNFPQFKEHDVEIQRKYDEERRKCDGVL